MAGFDWMGAAFVAAVVLWWLFAEGWDNRRSRRFERERERRRDGDPRQDGGFH